MVNHRSTAADHGGDWRSTTVAGGGQPLTAAGPPLTTTGPPVNGGVGRSDSALVAGKSMEEIVYCTLGGKRLRKNTTQSTQISEINDLIGEIIPCRDISSQNVPALSAKYL
nr:hypothetical protein [Tanacetum cinerariifolium]